MKKNLFRLSALLLIAAVAIAVYRFAFRKSIPQEVAPSEQVLAILQQNGCYDCHSPQNGKPFYADLPVVGSLVGIHVDHGTKFFNLDLADLENPSEVLLSMLEYTVHHDNMPILEYKAAHWGTGFNTAEKSHLQEWITQQRQQHYATGLATAQYANEPIQVIPDALPVDTAKVNLGRKLYNDPRLSKDNTISCATCHVLEKGGADPRGTRTSEGIYQQFGGINAPTVLNAVFNVEQFWNGRAHTLADQAAGPPVNPVEMGDHTWDDICAKLRTDAALVAQFATIYTEGITQQTVTDAIAEYEKTFITPNDALDRYLKGNATALTAEQIQGYQLFKDNTCATCHVGKTLGGQSFEYLGIFEDYFAARAQEHPDVQYNDDDKGLAGFTGRDEDLHRFKVPSLRNISKTAPYFHDGTMPTIEDAVKGMFRYELGRTATDEETQKISAFLRALDGEQRWN